MVGSAVETTVWSRAARNMPSIRAPMTTSTRRWDNGAVGPGASLTMVSLIGSPPTPRPPPPTTTPHPKGIDSGSACSAQAGTPPTRLPVVYDAVSRCARLAGDLGTREVTMEPELMPAAFLGHGDPMNALADNRCTRAWREFGASMPPPRAIVVVSAHWYVGSTLLTAMAAPRTIHDFYGFPTALYAVEYPAPGSPEVAREVAEAVKPRWTGLDEDGWGLDHGTWSVLVHAFPRADIPVIQLSVNGLEGYDDHFDLGTRLAPLRSRGILVLGSGNVVHNLGMMDRGAGEVPFDWAARFNEATVASMTEDPARVGRLLDHPDYRRAAPTPDHFLPLAPIAGIAAASDAPATVLADGYAYGSISMTAFVVR